MSMQKIKEALDAGLLIPAYAYSDNEAACMMAGCLRVIKAELSAQESASGDARECTVLVISLFAKNKKVEDFTQAIMQFAQSYHAKECAKCIGNLPALPHRSQS